MKFSAINCLLSIIYVLFFSIVTLAQSGLPPKLEKEYDSKDYIKCLKTAEKLINSNNINTVLYSYLYKAKTLVAISQNSSLFDQYPNAIKEALLSAESLKRKDKTGKIWDTNKEFFQDLREESRYQATQLYNNKEFDKAKILYEAIYKTFNDTIALYGIGRSQRYTADSLIANKTLEKVVKMLYKTFREHQLRKPYLPEAFTDFANGILGESIIDSAFKIISVGSYVYPNDELIKNTFFELEKSYIYYLLYNDKIYKALKTALYGARVYSDENRFKVLERKTMIEVTKSYTRDKIKGILELYDSYIRRHGPELIMEDLDDANLIFTDLILNSRRSGNSIKSANLTMILLSLNGRILDSLTTFETLSEKNRNAVLSNAAIHISRSLSNNLQYPDAVDFLEIAINTLNPEAKELLSKEISSLKKSIIQFSETTEKNISNWRTNKNPESLEKALQGLINLKAFEKASTLLSELDNATKYLEPIKKIVRKLVIDDFNYNYNGSYLLGDEELNWSGNLRKCNAGNISNTANLKVEKRINYYRRTAGVKESIQLDPVLNRMCQKGALIIKANDIITHDITKSMGCYSDEGKETISHGNLTLGFSGSNALMLQMEGNGGNESLVESRRWMLNPASTTMGHGSTDSSMVLWVIPKNENPVPTIYTQKFIAWPPEGFVPSRLIPRRWSFSLHNADFSASTVTMKIEERPIDIIQEKVINGPGLNTFVWRPTNGIFLTSLEDIKYKVEIFNVKIEGVPEPQSFSYEVIIIQP